MTSTTETARELLHRHGVPEDVIDGVLCLHAQELAAVIRSHPGAIPYRPQLDEDGGFWWDTRDRDAAADLIDPARGEAPAVSSSGRAALLHETALSDTERRILDYALNLAEEEMLARGDDEAELEALKALRRVAAEEQPAETQDGAVNRVIDLYGRWVKAGAPPLGTLMSRWWDIRLAELHAAILPPEQQLGTQEAP
ncbi:hypothetical protein ACWD25_52765 [Streptomyces sp. NPDC002920]